jgi:signal transduction histidine kinase
VYLEPQNERNNAALGYNMFSEATRREAMERARDTAAPAASGRVRLVQEIDPLQEQAGFLIYVPVYRGGSVPLSIDGRRQQLLGFVYSPFRTGDLLRGIIAPGEVPDVAFTLFDGPPSDSGLLYQSQDSDDPSRIETSRALQVGGRSWTLVLRSGPMFRGPADRLAAPAVAMLGTLLSLLLFAVTRGQVRARESAERIAAELRRSEKALREANRSKDDFLAIVSHELRTPLNAIVGWVAMLRRGQVPPEKQAHALEVIDRNAHAQARLVEDLLDINRAVSGRLRLELAEIDVVATLHAAVDAVRPAATAHRVEVACHTPPDLGSIAADPARLQQVLLNLLLNGIKFTKPGGQVRLAAEREGNEIVICVSDTGIGIDPDFLPYVFDRFRQADTSTTRAYSGVGLGLAIARHLVELHGGTIGVASEGEDKGTTFTIRLPAPVAQFV